MRFVGELGCEWEVGDWWEEVDGRAKGCGRRDAADIVGILYLSRMMRVMEKLDSPLNGGSYLRSTSYWYPVAFVLPSLNSNRLITTQLRTHCLRLL